MNLLKISTVAALVLCANALSAAHRSKIAHRRPIPSGRIRRRPAFRCPRRGKPQSRHSRNCLTILNMNLLKISTVAALVLSSCTVTRPLDARTTPNGARIGSSKQIVFLRGYDAAEGTAVAMDHAGLTAIDSVAVKRRIRAFGSAYITIVKGRP